MSKIFGILAVLQIGGIGFLLSTKTTEQLSYKNQKVLKKVTEEMMPVANIQMEKKEEVTQVEEPKDPYDYFIPKRRIISGGGIELNKNINALATLGEVMLENPLMVRAFERLVRDQFYNFYSDFIKEADLTPEEQLQLFQFMAQGMQDNMKNFLKAIGENMDRMSEFRNGPPVELLQGIRENNIALKDNLINSIGEEKFELFEQYHKEKSAAEDFMRLASRLERNKMPLENSQKDELRQMFIDQQASPFAEDTYEQQRDHEGLYKNTEGVLNKEQQESFKNSRKRHKRVYLLPF